VNVEGGVDAACEREAIGLVAFLGIEEEAACTEAGDADAVGEDVD
jgi:hypothetical protein